jgi:hypothetical protein
MKQIHKISTIAILVAVIGIITIGPAMGDKDSSEGHNKIEICHFDNEDKKYVKISLPENKAKGHNKHVNDLIPAPDDGCPEQEESQPETESDEGLNMNELLADLTRHNDIITEIIDSKCSLGEVVTGFGPNGELLCSPDNTGEDNTSNIISRTATVELASGNDLRKAYSCEAGEIIVGGSIEMPSLDIPLSNEAELFGGTTQIFNVKVLNDSQETVTVNVTWLCYGVI